MPPKEAGVSPKVAGVPPKVGEAVKNHARLIIIRKAWNHIKSITRSIIIRSH